MTSIELGKEEAKNTQELLPVSLLCGFLGAGKTTLMKHILETKHAQEDFRCAVVVNDMATLNIDKSLIDQSAIVQSDEVVAMQNGCFCCTLQSDLVDQIVSMAEKKMFNYMLIEASGVSEPSQIAPLFELCDDEHDHEAEHREGPQLGEVARLDTCVTVVDSAEFYNNLETMKVYEEGESNGTIAELMMEQVEYSNVVVLNKSDLVSKDQAQDIMDRITLLNPKAKVISSTQSRINVMDILNTHRFNGSDMEENSVMISATKVQPPENVEPEPECCSVSLAEGKKKCCKGKNKDGLLVDSGMSQILLGVIPNSNNSQSLTRHETRFGITSFVYRARRPFHPVRLHENFLDQYFMTQYEEEDDDYEDEEGEDDDEEKEEGGGSDGEGSVSQVDLTELQNQAKGKQEKRVKFMGELLRSKGFIWIATSNFILGGWQQAGNILRIEAESPWMCEMRDLWEGTISEELVRKDLNQNNGEEYPYADRRQELVFIGMRLNHAAIQKELDQCLLNDDEMKMGPEKWEEAWGDEDKIRLYLGGDDDDLTDIDEGEENDENIDGDKEDSAER